MPPETKTQDQSLSTPRKDRIIFLNLPLFGVVPDWLEQLSVLGLGEIYNPLIPLMEHPESFHKVLKESKPTMPIESLLKAPDTALLEYEKIGDAQNLEFKLLYILVRSCVMLVDLDAPCHEGGSLVRFAHDFGVPAYGVGYTNWVDPFVKNRLNAILHPSSIHLLGDLCGSDNKLC